jgi:hypothetical protein
VAVVRYSYNSITGDASGDLVSQFPYTIGKLGRCRLVWPRGATLDRQEPLRLHQA